MEWFTAPGDDLADYYGGEVCTMDVIEDDRPLIATGLFNADGEPLFRRPHREPIRFRIR